MAVLSVFGFGGSTGWLAPDDWTASQTIAFDRWRTVYQFIRPGRPITAASPLSLDRLLELRSITSETSARVGTGFSIMLSLAVSIGPFQQDTLKNLVLANVPL